MLISTMFHACTNFPQDQDHDFKC